MIASTDIMRLPPTITASDDTQNQTINYAPPLVMVLQPPTPPVIVPAKTIKDVAAYYMNRKGRKGRR